MEHDEATGELGWKRVVRTFVTADKETLALSFRDDKRGEHEQVDATAEHPFWLEGRGWVGAGSLRAGQRVLRADGRWLRVEQVEAKARRTTVYNLEVDGWHTYVVGELGAWVHNTCGPENLLAKFNPTQTARRFNWSKVKQYAEMMNPKGGGESTWDWSMDKIIVDVKNNIASGHHRVLAAQEAGVAIPESAIYRMNSVTPRPVYSWADILPQELRHLLP